jgi:signal transduction histidine kinase
MGYACQLEENTHLSAEERNQAAIIRLQSEKIKTLINDLNLASKLAYSMQPLNTSLISPAALIRQTVSEMINRQGNTHHPISVKIEPTAESCQIKGDEKLLARALTNLIENSIEHNPQGCTIYISAGINQNLFIIHVTDSGNGFSATALETLNHPLTTEVLENHGLGLLIVRQIIATHEGQIKFDNLPNSGSRVIIILPCQH